MYTGLPRAPILNPIIDITSAPFPIPSRTLRFPSLPLPSPHSVAPSLCPAPAHVTPPTEPPDPPNIAAGRVKRVRERNHHRCVHWYTTPTESRRYVSTHGCARCAGKAGELRHRAYTAIVHRARQQRALAASYRGFAPVQTVKMPVHTYAYACARWCAV